jgi:hypothetical protein
MLQIARQHSAHVRPSAQANRARSQQLLTQQAEIAEHFRQAQQREVAGRSVGFDGFLSQ